jgi:hypothetical protein
MNGSQEVRMPGPGAITWPLAHRPAGAPPKQLSIYLARFEYVGQAPNYPTAPKNSEGTFSVQVVVDGVTRSSPWWALGDMSTPATIYMNVLLASLPDPGGLQDPAEVGTLTLIWRTNYTGGENDERKDFTQSDLQSLVDSSPGRTQFFSGHGIEVHDVQVFKPVFTFVEGVLTPGLG